jgi:hypothetical protein
LRESKYISYSLWGDKPIYNIGIIKNIQQARDIYPGWKVVVYHDNSVPLVTIENIKSEGGEVVNVDGISYGMFWRFFAADLPDCGHVIFRDSDSRLSEREKKAVDEWIESGKSLHIMRDHPFHEIPFGSERLSILGGMWGIKGGMVSMKAMIETFSVEKLLGYGIDQTFLKQIQTLFQHDVLIHDEFFSASPFPIKRSGYRFVGERIDENDQPVGQDWKAIRDYYVQKSKKKKPQALLSRIYRKLFRT